MAVGGDETHRVGTQHEERAVQEKPRVFTGDRELCLVHHLAQRRTRQLRADGAARFRERREIFARKRLHPRVEPIRRDLHAAFVLGDADVRFGKRFDDLEKLLRRQRQRSALGNRRVALAAQADLEIGGKKTHRIAFRLHQHIGQDRDRVFSFHDALKKLQFSQ